MTIQGCYDAVQDRILLRLGGAVPGTGTPALWLTRRQWLAIALECYRVRTAAGPAKTSAPGGKKTAAKAPVAMGSADPTKTALVANLKFRRLPSGLRIHIETADGEPFILTLKEEGLASFIGLLEGLATKAKWDLSAGLLRMGLGRSVAPQKQVWH